MKSIDKLAQAQRRTGSILSIGLEPSPDYLPKAFPHTLSGYEEFLRLIIDATQDIAPVYKVNIAFFESLEWEGIELLYQLREHIPDDSFLIIDAKRGDIGSTAKHYAKSLYESLAADSVTLNPLMGKDSADPFLEYTDRLNYFLCLTSNPGADDFLLKNDLFLSIAENVNIWSGSHENCGLVTGATRPDYLQRISEVAPALPFLIPGVGAQGGSISEVLKATNLEERKADHLLHVTRGILPARNETGDVLELIRKKTEDLNSQVKTEREGASS